MTRPLEFGLFLTLRAGHRGLTGYASSAFVATSTPQNAEWRNHSSRASPRRCASRSSSTRSRSSSVIGSYMGTCSVISASNLAKKKWMVLMRVTPTAIGICGTGERLVGDEPALPCIERPGRVDRHHVAVARRVLARILAIDDCPELEVQRRIVRDGRDLGDRLARADEVTLSEQDLGDVVVVGDEAQPPGVMVDADVGRVAAWLDLDLHDAPAVGRVDAVPCFGGEVDGLVQAVEEMDARPVGFAGSSARMIWVVLQSGARASALRRSESKRPFSRRGWSGSSSGGLNNQDWWVTGTSGMISSRGKGLRTISSKTSAPGS